MSDYMKTVTVTPSTILYAEDTKKYGQTTSGRVQELISNGVKYENEGGK